MERSGDRLASVTCHLVYKRVIWCASRSWSGRGIAQRSLSLGVQACHLVHTQVVERSGDRPA
eukprot:8897012-Alexandrium_andersonii.AAC.1